MASIVLNNVSYFEKIRNDHSWTAADYHYRFLVEGDSWMHQSGAFNDSLLSSLAFEFDCENTDVLCINISNRGDTLQRMYDQAGDDFSGWLNEDLGWKFDALLLSTLGNDFIDAAREPAAGKGLLKNLAHKLPPTAGHECIRDTALLELVAHADFHFSRLYSIVRNSQHHSDIPIFLNNYDTPTARDAPALPPFLGGESWLYKAYKKNKIPEDLWIDLTASIFNDVQTTIAGWTFERDEVFTVPTDGVLTPSAAGSTGSDADWLNEIHPNAAGWHKLAKVWHGKLKEMLI